MFTIAFIRVLVLHNTIYKYDILTVGLHCKAIAVVFFIPCGRLVVLFEEIARFIKCPLERIDTDPSKSVNKILFNRSDEPSLANQIESL